MQTLELSVIGSHTAVIQRHSLHTLLGHILLSQHDGQLLSAVVTIVEEDHNIVGLNRTDNLTLLVDCNDRLNELIGNTLVIRLLHSLDHIARRLANTINQLIVSDLHTLPTLIAVHSIVTTDDRCNATGRFCQVVLQLLDKALTAARIGITTVHKAVNKGVLDTVLLRDVAQSEEVVERRVNATVRYQTHKVNIHAISLSILERCNDLLVLHNRTIGCRAVDLHQILINDATCTNIEVTHLRVTHLTVGQTNVLAIGTQLSVRILLGHSRDIGRIDRVDHIALSFVADTPTIEDHQQNLLVFHCVLYVFYLFNSFLINSTATSIAFCIPSGFLPPAVAKKG